MKVQSVTGVLFGALTLSLALSAQAHNGEEHAAKPTEADCTSLKQFQNEEGATDQSQNLDPVMLAIRKKCAHAIPAQSVSAAHAETDDSVHDSDHDGGAPHGEHDHNH